MSQPTTTITGNLTGDPELRFTPGGFALARFTVCVNKRTKNAQGEWEDGEPSFFDCTAWREMAENFASSATKGDRVIVVGRLEQQRWEKDGQKHSKIAVQVDEVGVSLRYATAEVQRVKREGPKQQAEPAPPAQVENPDDGDPF